jgi:hypothetical protein
MIYIYQHLGLGDHIVCNGLVRSLIKNDKNYTMFVKEHNFDTVKFMYHDLNNLNFLIGDDSFVHGFINQNKINNDQLLVLGFGGPANASSFDEFFYLKHKIPFECRWDKFKVDRDIESEIGVFNKFNVKEKEYIFIHDDERFRINIEKIYNPNKLPIIKCEKGMTNNIFDFCYTIENSVSFHSIESSLQFMVDSLNLSDNNNVHRYCRQLPSWEVPKYKTVKNIIL